MMASMASPPNDAVETKDGDVDGIKYRIYTPKNATKTGSLPVGVWTHGGGWMTGDLNMEDGFCRAVAEQALSIIVSVDYRLTPEHKAPTQLEDTLNVYNWALQNATSFGGDPSKFYSIGGSAGGALALQVANRIVKDPSRRHNIRGCAAITPITLHYDNVPEEYKNMYTAYEENGKDAAIIDKGSVETFVEEFGARPDDEDTWVALNKRNHQNFPPTYIAVCERDPIRDDGLVMEKALKAAGVPTKLDFYKELPHYFFIIPTLPETKQYIDNLVSGVKWLIAQM
jgi:versiconal hemiacetal acetate esterase